MYSTILVGTDGSAPAQRAVAAAGELALKCGIDRVHVVAGFHPISAGEMQHLAEEIPEELLRPMMSDAPGVNLVDRAKRVLETMGLDVAGHAVATSGAEAILEVAENVAADLIIVGSRGHGAGRRFLRGSVSTKVVHHAPCDVLIINSPRDES